MPALRPLPVPAAVPTNAPFAALPVALIVVAPACAVLLFRLIPLVSSATVSPATVLPVLPATVEVLAASSPS